MEVLYDIGIWTWAVVTVVFGSFVSMLVAGKAMLANIALCMLGGVGSLLYKKTNNQPVGFWLGFTTLFICGLFGGTSNTFLIDTIGMSHFSSGFGLIMLGAVAYPLFGIVMNKTLSTTANKDSEK